MAVRLDKWLQVARVFKTRSRATKACSLGRVRLNGDVAKPHRSVALEDRIEVRLADRSRILVVKELRDRPLPKAEAARLFEDRSPPAPPRLPAAGRRGRRGADREPGSGRPTKRDRRRLDRLRKR